MDLQELTYVVNSGVDIVVCIHNIYQSIINLPKATKLQFQ